MFAMQMAMADRLRTQGLKTLLRDGLPETGGLSRAASGLAKGQGGLPGTAAEEKEKQAEPIALETGRIESPAVAPAAPVAPPS